MDFNQFDLRIAIRELSKLPSGLKFSLQQPSMRISKILLTTQAQDISRNFMDRFVSDS